MRRPAPRVDQFHATPRAGPSAAGAGAFAAVRTIGADRHRKASTQPKRLKGAEVNLIGGGAGGHRPELALDSRHQHARPAIGVEYETVPHSAKLAHHRATALAPGIFAKGEAGKEHHSTTVICAATHWRIRRHRAAGSSFRQQPSSSFRNSISAASA